MIRITIAGLPAPQGSKTRTNWGVREDNPRTKPWRAAVADEALRTMEGVEPLSGPVEAHVLFYFPRPKNHYGSGKNAEVLKQTAPTFHASKPDSDKLQRAIGDSLSGIALRDDAQIVHWNVWKLYGKPRCEIILRPAPVDFLPFMHHGPFSESEDKTSDAGAPIAGQLGFESSPSPPNREDHS